MAEKKPSSGDVIRALAEEARERDPHPDRRSVFDAFLGEQDGEQDDQEDGDKGEPDARTTTTTETATRTETPAAKKGQK